MLFLVMLINFVGGFEKFVLDFSLNDGMFDLMILKKVNFVEFIRVVMMVFCGEYINDQYIIYIKVNCVKVNVLEKMQLNLDGEYGGMLLGEFVNLY